MSYGEPFALGSQGLFIELVEELVREEGVVFVTSAGNSGPALSTVGAPGGALESLISYLSSV